MTAPAQTKSFFEKIPFLFCQFVTNADSMIANPSSRQIGRIIANFATKLWNDNSNLSKEEVDKLIDRVHQWELSPSNGILSGWQQDGIINARNLFEQNDQSYVAYQYDRFVAGPQTEQIMEIVDSTLLHEVTDEIVIGSRKQAIEEYKKSISNILNSHSVNPPLTISSADAKAASLGAFFSTALRCVGRFALCAAVGSVAQNVLNSNSNSPMTLGLFLVYNSVLAFSSSTKPSRQAENVKDHSIPLAKLKEIKKYIRETHKNIPSELKETLIQKLESHFKEGGDLLLSQKGKTESVPPSDKLSASAKGKEEAGSSSRAKVKPSTPFSIPENVDIEKLIEGEKLALARFKKGKETLRIIQSTAASMFLSALNSNDPTKYMETEKRKRLKKMEEIASKDNLGANPTYSGNLPLLHMQEAYNTVLQHGLPLGLLYADTSSQLSKEDMRYIENTLKPFQKTQDSDEESFVELSSLDIGSEEE